VADWGYELLKNRERKIRALERKLESMNRTPAWEPKEIPEEIDRSPVVKWTEIPETDPKRKRKNVFLIQMVAAAMLFLVTLIGMRYPVAEEWITTAWNQKIPYEKLSAYYQEIVGSRPTLLPVFSGKKKEEPVEKWTAPVKGKVVLSFNEQRKGVVIQTAANVKVTAARTGVVTFVGNKTGIGQTVIIQHKDGKQTWYGFLGKIPLKVNEEVKQGQLIGQVTSRSNQYFVYIGLQESNQFIDPTGIIPFR
jgi:stage IV sporulation protein FA